MFEEEMVSTQEEDVAKAMSRWSFFAMHPVVLHEEGGEKRYFTSLAAAAHSAMHTQYLRPERVYATSAGESFCWQQLREEWAKAARQAYQAPRTGGRVQ